jgi:hypothetical protein
MGECVADAAVWDVIQLWEEGEQWQPQHVADEPVLRGWELVGSWLPLARQTRRRVPWKLYPAGNICKQGMDKVQIWNERFGDFPNEVRMIFTIASRVVAAD